ncbi:MAG: NUDIX domain-containing protein [Bacteroidota bacterium]|nr:NUDIX domain-containing protein [Bacteroidota bacterium]
MINKFNVRVYGIYLNENKELLLIDEFRNGVKFTKFPGGGLEFGEGTVDCLKRESLEELSQKIEITDHFYTTDFFQQSAFNKSEQLISIYYLMKIKPPFNFLITQKLFDFKELKEGAESFRVVPLDQIKPEDLLFPIDKKVLLMLKERML